jgi:hypothetical protein
MQLVNANEGDLVPEVGIPSVNSGQAHRHGVEAPRDFETSQPKPYPPKISLNF